MLSYFVAIIIALALSGLGIWLGFKASSMIFANKIVKIREVETQEISEWVKWRLFSNSGMENSYSVFATGGVMAGAIGLGFFLSSITGGAMFFMVAIAILVFYLNASSFEIRASIRLKALNLADVTVQEQESINRVELWLDALLAIKTEEIHKAGIEATFRWGSERSLRVLMEYLDRNMATGHRSLVLAAGSKYANRLEKSFEALEVERISSYPGFMGKNQYWLRLAKDAFAGENWEKGIDKEAQGKKAAVVLAKLEKQKDLKAAGLEKVFCVECNSRAKNLNYKGWKYVRCKTCQEMTFLRTGITNVVGVLGPLEQQGADEEKYYISMWDTKGSQAMPAEIDRLEIRSGIDGNYDWMVSATLEALRNRFPQKKLSFEVVLDPKVELSPNTRSLIQGLQV